MTDRYNTYAILVILELLSPLTACVHQDVFYLTIEELVSFVEGRCVTNDLSSLVAIRRKEFDGYRKGLPPPQRFMTRGACGPYMLFPQLLDDLDLLKDLEVTKY